MSGRSAVVAILLVVGAAVTALQPMGEVADFQSVLDIYAGLLRDLDQTALQAAPLSIEDEERVARRFDAPGDGATWDPRAHPQFSTLTAHIAPGRGWRLRVSPSLAVNAFALPGGRIVVFEGLLTTMTPDEVAGVLAHEIGHVELRHCIERMQAEARLKKVGLRHTGQAIDLFRAAMAQGYDQQEEADADRFALSLMKKANYPPRALVSALQKMQGSEATAPPRAGSATTETLRAVDRALENVARSHPPLPERITALQRIIDANGW